MISGFLTIVHKFPPDRQHIEERPLIIDFCIFSTAFGSEAFDKRTNRVSTDVADKHARYIARLLLGPAKSRRSRMNWAILAHIVASITVLWQHRHYICREGTPCKRKGLPRCLVPLPREWRPTGHVFLASSCLTPNKGICSI